MTDDNIDKEKLQRVLRGIKTRAWEEWQMASECDNEKRMGEASGKAHVATQIAGEFGVDITDGARTPPMDEEPDTPD